VTETSAVKNCVAFQGAKLVASGDLHRVAAKLKHFLEQNPEATILVFDAETSEPVELDLRGSMEEVLARLTPREPKVVTEDSSARGPGRPRLGVVARELTLLPRHWEWLSKQPGGASVAVRKLVEEARHTHQDEDRLREARESAYRFISAVAGDFPGFEEATRALFAPNEPEFNRILEFWPIDVRRHAKKLAATAFEVVKILEGKRAALVNR
jgi:hypothetical protein